MDVMRYIVSDRSAHFAELQAELTGATKSDCKIFTLAVMYGGSPAKQCKDLGFQAVPKILIRLRREVQMAAGYVAGQFPDKLDIMRSLEKNMPRISLLSYYAASKQRECVDKCGSDPVLLPARARLHRDLRRALLRF